MILVDLEMFEWDFMKAFSDRVNFLSVQGPKFMVLDVEKTGVKYSYLSVSVRKSMN